MRWVRIVDKLTNVHIFQRILCTAVTIADKRVVQRISVGF